MRRFLIVLCLIALFIVGLKSFILQFQIESISRGYDEMLRPISVPVRILIAFLVMLLPLIVALEAWLRHPSRRKLALKGRDGGRLELRESVIEKIVRQSVAELPEIERIRVGATSSRTGLKVKIRVKARDVRNVPELDDAIRLRADQSLRRILGIQEIHSVDVSLEDMSSFDRSSTGEEMALPPYPPARGDLESQAGLGVPEDPIVLRPSGTLSVSEEAEPHPLAERDETQRQEPQP